MSNNISLDQLQKCIDILDNNNDINTKAKDISEALNCNTMSEDEFEKFFFSDEVLEL